MSSMSVADAAVPSVFIDQTIQHQKFAISSYPAEGLGDLVAGVSMVRFLQNQGIPSSHISFCTRTLSDMRPFIRQLRGSGLVSKAEVLVSHDVAMHIMLPVPVSSLLPEYLATGKPVLVISEYGADPFPNTLLPCSHFRTRSLGLDREHGELGIFVHHPLAQWTHIPDHASVEERSREFQGLPIALQLELLKQASSEQEFFQNNLIYFGYAYDPASIIAFLLSVANLPGRQERDIVAILPRLDPQKMNELIRPYLSELQARTVSFTTYQGKAHSSWTLCNTSESGQRNVSIVSGTFTQDDILTFLKFAESETIATGDQSMSLAISSGKCAVYEARPHKKKFKEQLCHFFGPDIAFDTRIGSIPNIERQRDVYRSYFLHDLEDRGQERLAIQQKLIAEYDCQVPLAREIESLYHDWMESQGKPSPFVSLYHLNRMNICGELERGQTTILSSDQAAFLEAGPKLDENPGWQIESHIGFSVVRCGPAIESDRPPQ